MAHFAQLDDNDIVVNVLVVDNAVIAEPDGTENEFRGIKFLEEVCGQNYTYVQTSINANFRGEFAVIGGQYDRSLDVFVSPDPEPLALPSWVTDETQRPGTVEEFEWN